MNTYRITQTRGNRLWDSRNSSLQARQGFTLVELLVVFGILAVLFGFVVSALARAKTSAHRIVCLNNVRQWVSATHLYAHENEDFLPREAAVDGINSWEITAASTNRDVWYNALAETMLIPAMAQYAQTPSWQQDFYAAGKMFHCPRARFGAVAATYPNFSLAMNSKLMRDFESTDPSAGMAGARQRRLGEVKAPDRTALFLDGGVPDEERLCAYQAPFTGQPKAFASQFPGRHNRGGNIGFVDGHVRTLPGKDVVEMNPASVHRGRAIFPPVEVVWRHDPNLVP
jgi:prepilin-type processing-associated H-X9-DG protein/prepilin-type N-terminal cleavage/methylation domain-containing protein